MLSRTDLYFGLGLVAFFLPFFQRNGGHVIGTLYLSYGL